MAKRQPEDLEKIGARVKERYEEGIKYAANFRDRIDLLAPYIEATRSGVQSRQAPGQALLSRMYDSEGISSADLAVRQMGSYLHGSGTRWFGLEDESPFVNAEDEAREWYEDSRDRMLREAANGAFYPESYEHDMDWIGFGTGDMMVEKKPVVPGRQAQGWPGARFTHNKAGRFVCFENGVGIVDEKYVELRKSAKAAVDLWGLDNMPDNIKEAYTNNKADEFRFVHGIYPRKHTEKAYGNRAMPWASCYVHYDTAKVVAESGYEEFPGLVTRWSRCFGEPYGRGLGEIALNTLITLNAATKLDLEASTLRIKPALAQRHDAVIGSKRFSPWGVTVVRVAPGEPLSNALAPIVTNLPGYNFNNLDGEKLRQVVRRIFYADMLEQLMALEGQQEMRVYVFQQKQNSVQKMLGPTYGRWESEFGIPWVARLFNMMLRDGALAPIPDVILEMGGQPKVRFESPLARAQRMEEVDAMNAAMQALMPIIQMQLDEWKMTGRQPHNWVLDGYDFDKYRIQVDQNYGVPAKVTRTTREVMAIRGSRAEAEAQAAKSQELMQAAEGLGKVAPLLLGAGQQQPKAA